MYTCSFWSIGFVSGRSDIGPSRALLGISLHKCISLYTFDKFLDSHVVQTFAKVLSIVRAGSRSYNAHSRINITARVYGTISL